MMSKLLSILLTGLLALFASGQQQQQQQQQQQKPNTEVNFAAGGATSGDSNLLRYLDSFSSLIDLVDASGLVVPGLQQQLEWAAAATVGGGGEVKPNRDLFWLHLGTNDFTLNLITTGGQLLPDPTVVVDNIAAALDTIYNDFGGRYIVLSNLIPYGNLPDTQRLVAGLTAAGGGAVEILLSQLNLLSSQFNVLLADAVADFQTQNTDAHVVLVDLENIYLLQSNDPDINSSDSCTGSTIGGGAPPTSCDGYVFMDGTHFTTSFNKLWAQEAYNKLVDLILNNDNPDNDEDGEEGRLFRRMITFGDSYSDTGSVHDIFFRSSGFVYPPDPPYYNGRASDGPNVIDHLEDLMNVKYPSSHYVQQ